MGCLDKVREISFFKHKIEAQHKCESLLMSMLMMLLLCQINYDHIEIFMSKFFCF